MIRLLLTCLIACICGVALPAVDLGDGWQGHPSKGHLLVSVSFADDDHGWASGINSLMRTVNGGETWVQQWDERARGSYWFNNIVALDREVAMATAFAYGRNAPGLVLRTTDGGATWAPVAVGTADDAGFTSLVFASDHRTGWLVSNREGLFTTTDAGLSWRRVETEKNATRSNVSTQQTVAVAGTEVFVGAAEFILHSRDLGATWETLPMPPAARNPHLQLGRIAFATPAIGWLNCYGGDAWQTADGGRTWQPLKAPGNVYCVPGDAKRLWALSTYEIATSTDGGTTWTKPSRIGGGKESLRAAAVTGKRIHVVGGDEGQGGCMIADKLLQGERADPLADGIVPIAVDIPGDGYLTIEIRDAQGRVVDQPVSGVPVRGGKRTVMWDMATLDEYWTPFERMDGHQFQPPTGVATIAAPGAYTWRGLWHPGLTLKLDTTFSPLVKGRMPWLTPDNTGGWLGDHEAPRDVVRTGDTMWVGTFCEGGHALLEADLGMRKQWGSSRIELACPRVLAADGDFIYYLEQGGWVGNRMVMIQVNRRTKDARRLWLGEIGAATYGDPAVDNRPGDVAIEGLAVRGDRAYLSDRGKQAVVVIDLTENLARRSDQLKTVAVIPVERPGRIRPYDARRLAVVAGKGVTLIDTETSKTEQAVKGLDDPLGFDVDAAGNFYVGEMSQHLVKVFDRTGKALRTIGKGGKHPLGAYTGAHVESPAGIAVDAKGRVWVAEHSITLKRTSVWDAQGRCINEVLDGPEYGGAGDVHPEDPNRFFVRGQEYRRDPKSGTIRLVNLIWREDDTTYERFTERRGHNFHGPSPAYPVVRDGKLFFSLWGGYGMGEITEVWVYDKDRVRPVAACGHPPARLAERLGIAAEQAGIFAWTDRNEDGIVQTAEAVVAPYAPLGSVWGSRMNRDFAVAFANSDGQVGISFFQVQELTKQGYPVWKLPKAPTMIPDFAVHDPYQTQSVLSDAQGNAIINAPFLTSFRPDGTIAWRFKNRWPGLHSGNRATNVGIEPGVLAAPLRFYGTARTKELGEVFCLGTNYGATHLFTADGLYIARVFEDSRRGELWRYDTPPTPAQLARTSLGQEHFGGTFQQVGERYCYVVAGGGPVSSVVELQGLNQVRRLAGGSLTVTGAQLVAAQHLRQERARKTLEPKRAVIARLDAVVIDGKADEWPKDAVRIDGFLLGYDAGNLYLHVAGEDDRAPFANAATSSNFTEAFKRGDTVDLMLATDPTQPADRRTAGLGDLRLSLAMVDGKPQAVRYRPVVPGTPPAVRRSFSSPWQTETIDRVELVPEARIAVVRSERGFSLEAAIPLAALGLDPERTPELRGDVGRVISDQTGTAAVDRIYWSNKDTRTMADLPSEARLQPALWGTFTFAP